jgi:hypothetical protein
VVVVAAEGTPAETAVVAMSDQAVRAMAVLTVAVIAAAIAASPRMPGPQMSGPHIRASAATATARACRLNTRIIPVIGVMPALASDRTLSVTITLAVVKAAPANPRADSLPVAVVVAGSGIARAADARAGDAKRNGGVGSGLVVTSGGDGGTSRNGDASKVPRCG